MDLETDDIDELEDVQTEPKRISYLVGRSDISNTEIPWPTLKSEHVVAIALVTYLVYDNDNETMRDDK